ncbi:MAG TPA: haloacid dehalogenase-like hydrolase [Methylococcaceae bacterium]|jgi:2'-5' RNA ligase|nr:haloacid dehalogenase-like hydrolase [Methylococcaceae bacterium]
MKILIHTLRFYCVLLFLGWAAPAPVVQAAESKSATTATAIDILLDPDATMIAQANAANARLRENYPAGFALDADHAPHITLLQRFVRSADLEQVKAAVANVFAKTDPTQLKLQATGYYYLPYQNLGVAGITIAPTPALLGLQKKLISAVAPFTVERGTGEAFVPRSDGGPINQPTMDYVATYVPEYSGKKFNPHVTVGLGDEAFVKQLLAEPFKTFTFKARSASLYQLGDFGTAQKQLWTSASADPLPSWNDGKTKQAIVDFVAKVTKQGSSTFVPPAERIATFDNDGTLWAEQPFYFQGLFVFDRARKLAPQHPEWKTQQPFKSVLENDMKGLAASGEKGLVEIVMATHAGMTTGEFEQIVKDWLASARHPKLNRPYTELVYQPMLELLTFLRANGFKTYIVSGGGIEFMRPWTEQVYGIPPEQVVGSSIKTQFELRDGKPVLVRLPEVDFIDDKAGKPVGIHKFIGKRPIAAFGNSDGDLQMLQWTCLNDGAHFCLIVHHTDAEREWAYDRQSSVGRLDRALDEAQQHGWTVVSIKEDWKQIFPISPRQVKVR